MTEPHPAYDAHGNHMSPFKMVKMIDSLRADLADAKQIIRDVRAEQLSLRDRLGEALVRENNLLAENANLRGELDALDGAHRDLAFRLGDMGRQNANAALKETK